MVQNQSTPQRLFAKLDPERLGGALGRAWAFHVPVPSTRGSQGVAVDGKAQRGRLTAFCHEKQIVLSQVPITTTAAKAEAELTWSPKSSLPSTGAGGFSPAMPGIANARSASKCWSGPGTT
jgi:hypothetical protein